MRKLTALLILGTILIAVFGCGRLSESASNTNLIERISKADELFKKKQFQEALKEYENIEKTASGDMRLKALYRIIESKAMLFRYGEALEKITGIELPKEPIWQARFLLLKAEIYREFLKRYGFA